MAQERVFDYILFTSIILNAIFHCLLPLSFALSYGYRFVSDTFYTSRKQNSTICFRYERACVCAPIYLYVFIFFIALALVYMTYDVFVQNTLLHDIEINVREKPVAEIHTRTQ